MWFLIVSAFAEMPLPDYADSLVQARWYEVNSLIEAGCTVRGITQDCNPEPLDEAIAKARNFESTVVEDARLAYLIGLASKLKGDTPTAQKEWERAVRLDDTRADAWHDLGELYLAQDNLEGAAKAFGHVSELVHRGSRAWLGPWRQAEVAAHQGDADGFETHMRVALERGFSFRMVKGLPNWKAFLANPALGPSVEKLITVYGTKPVLDSLRAPSQDGPPGH